MSSISEYTGKGVAIASTLLGMEAGTSLFRIPFTQNGRELIKTLKCTKWGMARIDDILDADAPEIISDFKKLGTTDGGTEISPALNMVLGRLEQEYGDNKFIQKFLQLTKDDKELSPSMVAFGNMFCHLFKSELISKLAGDRQEAARKHIDISGVYGGMMSHLIKHYQGKKIDVTKLDSEAVRQRYPRAYTTVAVMQALDDIYDSALDASQEKNSGVVSSNYWLAALSKNGLADKFIKQYGDVSKITDPIRPDSLGKEYTKTLRKCFDELKHDCRSLPFAARMTMDIYINKFVDGNLNYGSTIR